MELLKRNEIKEEYKWDLTRLYKDSKEYLKDVEGLKEKVLNFSKYKDNLKDAKTINQAILDYEEINIILDHLSNYVSLTLSVDQTNDSSISESGRFSIVLSDVLNKLAFFTNQLMEKNEEILLEVVRINEENRVYIDNILKDKKRKLSNELEETLILFNNVFEAPYENYEKFKLADMKFNNIKVDNKEYKMSFTLFENNYSFNSNHKLRREAFASFYDKLGEYENGLANNYYTHLLKEKNMSKLRGYDSVIDYLLEEQDVTREMFDRQLDVIMEKLSEPIRKYAKHIKKLYNLDTLTYADLHLSIDDSYEPKVTVGEAKKEVLKALSIFGRDYAKMVERSFSERWTDFLQNVGKSTGGFCASPYNKGSYILLNWNDLMSEALVLAHELGHAGHFYYAGKNQRYLNTEPSLYFIEAPSTMNELIMGESLKNNSDDPRFKRWVLSTMISKTYYHNMVTHLLEAYFQREVYNLIDNEEVINASVLNQVKLDVLKKFFKDDVEIPDYAKRTWMRQPHYFMGLYPYTYSAGLTVATSFFTKVKNKEEDISLWLEVLKKGGTLNPLELARVVNVDLKTEKPLVDTIKNIDSMIDEIINLSKIIKS